jgi:acyl-CoA ligase (AMP-forming) (exosortase A-associated)
MEPPYLVHHLLERAASRRPRAEAIVDGDRRLDWAACAEEARTVAGRLCSEGLQRRDRVAIHLPKSVGEVVSIFGASLAGGVFVPVNVLLRPPQVRHILQDCGVRFLVTDAARWRELQPVLTDLPSLERVLLVDGEADEAQDDARVVPQAFRDGEPAAGDPGVLGEDLAAILYTSGSTGSPKGVMLSHRNVVAGSRIVARYLSIREDERILSVLPFSFDYGLNQLMTAAELGATLVLLTFRFGDEIVRAIEAERCTALAGVPTVWALLTRAAPKFKSADLSSLRYITNSGGAVPAETVRKLRERLPTTRIFLMYGLTEAFRSTYLPPEEIDARPTSMGRAIPETEIFVYHEGENRLCRAGEEGILVHRGPTVSLGYWGRPDDTARVLRPNPLVAPEIGGDTVCFSGDLVRKDDDGYLYFVGRGDAMIKSSGYRISPTEVEEVLMASGVLAQAAVIGLSDPVVGQRVHGVVVAADGCAPDPATLLERCAQALPPHMVPRAIEVVSSLPRSPNGKVDYKVLRAEREAAS